LEPLHKGGGKRKKDQRKRRAGWGERKSGRGGGTPKGSGRLGRGEEGIWDTKRERLGVSGRKEEKVEYVPLGKKNSWGGKVRGREPQSERAGVIVTEATEWEKHA